MHTLSHLITRYVFTNYCNSYHMLILYPRGVSLTLRHTIMSHLVNISIIIADPCMYVTCGAGWCLADETFAIGFICECPENYYGEFCEFAGIVKLFYLLLTKSIHLKII